MGAKLGGGGGGGRGRRQRAVMADINVTPMVDVMLVLLVIFMITAPLLTAGVEVNLPKAKAKAISQQDNKPLEISLDAKGNIAMGDTKMRQEEMVAKLTAIAAETPDLRIYIRADSRLDYGKVMVVMAAVNTAGFTKIALVTDPTQAQK
jgi:biopolymer transport protein TolR